MEIKKIKRIGIDARFYGPISQKGLGRYTKEIVDGITGVDARNEYIIFLTKNNFEEFKTNNPNVKKVLANAIWYSVAEQIKMPFLIWREKLDLMHFTHFNVPIFCPTKFIVTIHDLILTKHPTQRASRLGPILYRIKNLAYRFTIFWAVTRSKAIITVSRFTKDDIIKTFKAANKKIFVTYEGVSNNLKKNYLDDDKKVLLRYNIIKKYLLYVGNAYPHKNLESLIEIFPNIKEKYPDIQLIFVGKKDYFYQQLINKAKKNKYQKSIIFTGHISDSELISLYKNAQAFVFPSLFEGFGLPPLEAMHHNCPVLSSNKTCLPEILGDACLFFDPHNKKEYINQILKLLGDPNIQDELIQKGKLQIKKYNWQTCIKQTLKIYQQFI